MISADKVGPVFGQNYQIMNLRWERNRRRRRNRRKRRKKRNKTQALKQWPGDKK